MTIIARSMNVVIVMQNLHEVQCSATRVTFYILGGATRTKVLRPTIAGVNRLEIIWSGLKAILDREILD